MAREKTGQLICENGWYYVRVTREVDGVKIRPRIPLGTKNILVAKAKQKRLNVEENPTRESAKRAETFAEAAARVFSKRTAEGNQYAQDELNSLAKHAFPIIGKMAVSDADIAVHINSVLEAAKSAGLGQGSVGHIKQRIGAVFKKIATEPGGPPSPMANVVMPDFPKTVEKERAVLTDAEFAIYLAWEPDSEGARADAVLERQVMACVARMFGGLRTSDLHALKWDSFDVEHGGFAWGWAPRKKTRRPQKLEVPEPLRPFLLAWWERHGRPQQGVVFPVRRAGKRGNRTGQARVRVSHAEAFRRDLQRAFSVAGDEDGQTPRPGSHRWRELFEETEYTLPIDFHSWRRAYAQALADADVNAQQAAALTGHSSLAVHAQYLKNAGKMRRMPDGALPQLSFRQRAGSKGSEVEQSGSREINDTSLGANAAEILHASEPARALSGLRIRWSGVRIPPGALKNDDPENQKAGALPFDVVTALPAQPNVRLLDLLAAIDAAALAGDLHAVRALAAEATRLERERLGTGAAAGGTGST